MSRSMPLLGAISLAFGAASTWGAEDHSAHRHGQPPQPATEEHAQHGNAAAEDDRKPNQDEHAEHRGHSDESTQRDEHAGHETHEQQPSDEPTESERNHVPPPPPEHPMHDMSNEEMIELMQMDDTGTFGMLLLDQLEWQEIDDRDALAWEGQAWYGNDYTKLRVKSEGERVAGEYEGRAELYVDRVVARWWNLQAGVRQDFGEGPSRSWAAFGVQGLAPYWFEVEATAYVGEQGRTAAIFSGEYEILLTQRLILQPKIEFDLYGKADRENGIGTGLADMELALRLRYEFRREFAPYVGVVWTRLYGETADFARQEGHDTDDLQLVAGLRVWF
jgi:copper resistance protein B